MKLRIKQVYFGCEFDNTFSQENISCSHPLNIAQYFYQRRFQKYLNNFNRKCTQLLRSHSSIEKFYWNK